MNFLTSTRRYYKFSTDVIYNKNGIQTANNEIWFPKSSWFKKEDDILKFSSIGECETYYKDKIMEHSFNPEKKLIKTFTGIQTKALQMKDEDWEIIKGMMPNPDIVKNPEKDIRTFQAHLANNFVDRDKERFRKDVLKSFAETIVGKNKLMAHQWSHPGNGKFFKAKLEKMSIQETLDFVGGHPDKNFENHLNEIADKDGGIYWLLASYYMPNMTEAQKETVMNVDLGMWSAMSIGFRAAKLEKIKADNDEERILYWEYQNTKERQAEALEGSHVGVPAQYGVQTSKDFNFNSDKWIDEIKDIDDETKIYIKNLDKKIIELNEIYDVKAAWTTNYINNLEDNCFAIIEPGLGKDDSGRTIPRTARHLPHHAKGNGGVGTGGKVDLPHLRNALARMNLIKPVSANISQSDLRKKASKHIIAHAKKLQIGEYDQRSTSMNFKIEQLGVNLTINEDKLETDLKTVQDAVKAGMNVVIEKFETDIEEKDTEIEELGIDRDNAVNDMNKMKTAKDKAENDLKVYTDVLGDMTIDELKDQLNTAKAYREALVDNTVNFAKACEVISEDEIETKKTEFNAMKINELEKMRDFFKKCIEKGGKNLLDSKIPDNADDPDNKDDSKREFDFSNYRPNDYKQD